MTSFPFAIVTSTTEIIRGVPRVRVNEAYIDALAKAGLVPLVLPPLEPNRALAALDGPFVLVLTGGEDMNPSAYGQAPHPAAGEPHEARDAYELALARAARDRRIPTLCICRGLQVMNVALGGSLIQDIPSQRPSNIVHDPEGKRAERVHSVSIDAGSQLANVVGATSIRTNSSHHQSIDRIGDHLRIVARSDDGIVEGIESTDPDWWMVGVQWHPEELIHTAENLDRRIFAAFAEEARRGVFASLPTAVAP
ncbi:MAG: gamma-glutamyl-gamma-aminobutyrate hydrolase family protein [Gemmatimonadaceae bacterium]